MKHREGYKVGPETCEQHKLNIVLSCFSYAGYFFFLVIMLAIFCLGYRYYLKIVEMRVDEALRARVEVKSRLEL